MWDEICWVGGAFVGWASRLQILRFALRAPLRMTFVLLDGACYRWSGVVVEEANFPSHLATTTLARQFPVTFREVRPMSIRASTPRIRTMGSRGRWKWRRWP